MAQAGRKEEKTVTGLDIEKESTPLEISKDNLDVFGDEEGNQIHYKTLSWQFVAFFMIAEIVSNGMLSLPNALATVGIIPAVILIIFLGVFALFTAKLLIDFKLNHPNVHSMGDAGQIIFGPIGREVLSLGTIVFSIFAAGSEVLSGQLALSLLSNNGLCAIFFALIFTVAAFLVSLPRALSGLTWLGVVSSVSILIAGLAGMIGAGANPVPDRIIQATVPQTFNNAFLAITNPAAWVLQGFATTFYVIFAVVMYVYIGSTVNPFAFSSLPPVWAKVAVALAIPNFLISGGLYIHVPAKLVFVRIFRRSKHVHSHTILGWVIWVALCAAGGIVAFLFVIAVPIFSFLIGLTAALFASWYTYGLAGFFYLHDAYYLEGGKEALKKNKLMVILSILTILAGGFICVAGTYVFIKLLVDAYRAHQVPKPFTC
ncbi:amino acid transporter [Hysterangium stoloniferum]|nr:amino acid transporter [Hysterangium stoloniferum]